MTVNNLYAQKQRKENFSFIKWDTVYVDIDSRTEGLTKASRQRLDSAFKIQYLTHQTWMLDVYLDIESHEKIADMEGIDHTLYALLVSTDVAHYINVLGNRERDVSAANNSFQYGLYKHHRHNTMLVIKYN